MKIVSYNLNGLRSALRHGLLDWVAATEPDVLCVQEIKAGTTPLDVSGLAGLGYHAYLHPARKPGLQRRGHLQPPGAQGRGGGLRRAAV